MEDNLKQIPDQVKPFIAPTTRVKKIEKKDNKPVDGLTGEICKLSELTV
jgi:hypothetical protein